MLNKIFSIFFIILMVAGVSSEAFAQKKSKNKNQPENLSEIRTTPKLVVGIVVDQMRYDYLTRFWNHYGDGGFKRMVGEGVKLDFIPFHVAYAFIKTLVFAFVLATIPSFHGFYMKGGALEVGKASTTSFVWTSVVIIVLNLILTQLFLG